ncbi:uncharacterized protein LOC117583904 [Drosophila guanche]|uniref:Blast:Protein distal antenna-related n=1 Tax=Drosophila guanche TaxID=7266 RepID=A0A3B0JJ85_DROGU|nr:uncharacterized protein LOC117583904 [Drosophila guanche]SPP75390.1 blast:Protein distal antenna-related [Drosophila guanche]
MEKFGAPRGKRPRVQVSIEQKEQAIARIIKGETKAGISRELGVPESTVRGWVKRSEQRSARGTEELQDKKMMPSPPKVWKVPQKRKLNGHPVAPVSPSSMAAARKYIRESLAMPMLAPTPMLAPRPHPVVLPPLPLPFPMPLQSLNETDDSQMISWLHIFNAGILNFTCIATAAVEQARALGYANRLTLWQIINKYVEEAALNVSKNGGVFVNPLPKPYRPRNGKISTSNVPHHITAEDDEENEEPR